MSRPSTGKLSAYLFERSLPLPKDVPMAFRTLPEYILEDIIDYPLFVIRSV
jgi:hypothetical protein